MFDWIDWVDPQDLVALVAQHDVCLGIFGTTPKAKRVVPQKVYQGCAAGRAVITSGTDPQRRILGDSVAYVEAGDPSALAAMLHSLDHDRDRVRELGRKAETVAVNQFAPVVTVEPLVERLPDGIGSSA